jgi:hypothetical protein
MRRVAGTWGACCGRGSAARKILIVQIVSAIENKDLVSCKAGLNVRKFKDSSPVNDHCTG